MSNQAQPLKLVENGLSSWPANDVDGSSGFLKATILLQGINNPINIIFKSKNEEAEFWKAFQESYRMANDFNWYDGDYHIFIPKSLIRNSVYMT